MADPFDPGSISLRDWRPASETALPQSPSVPHHNPIPRGMPRKFDPNEWRPADIPKIDLPPVDKGWGQTIREGFSRGVERAGAGLSGMRQASPETIASDLADVHRDRPSETEEAFGLEQQRRAKALDDAWSKGDKVQILNSALSILGHIASNPKQSAGVVAESLGTSVPAFGSAAGGALAGGMTAGPVGAVVGGVVGYVAGNFATNVQASMAERLEDELARRRVDTSKPSEVARALRAEPDLLIDAREYAIQKGSATAAVEGAVDLATLGAGRALRPARSLIGRAGRAAGIMGSQGVSEGAGQVAGDLAVGEDPSPGQALTEGLYGAVAGIPEGAAMFAGGRRFRQPLSPQSDAVVPPQPQTPAERREAMLAEAEERAARATAQPVSPPPPPNSSPVQNEFDERVTAAREVLSNRSTLQRLRDRIGSAEPLMQMLAVAQNESLPHRTRETALDRLEARLLDASQAPDWQPVDDSTRALPGRPAAALPAPELPDPVIQVDSRGNAGFVPTGAQAEIDAMRAERGPRGLTPDVDVARGARLQSTSVGPDFTPPRGSQFAGSRYIAPDVEPSDLVGVMGVPFMMRSTAQRVANASGGHVIPVNGGYVVRNRPGPAGAGPDAGSGTEGAVVDGGGDGAIDAATSDGTAAARLHARRAEPAAPVQPGLPGHEALAQRWRAQRESKQKERHNRFLAFLRKHGVSVAETQDITGESPRLVQRMVPGVFRKNGTPLDDLVHAAREAGYITQADIDSDRDTGGTRKLSEMIRKAVFGERIETLEGMETEAERASRESLDEELIAHVETLGLDTRGMTVEEVAEYLDRFEDRLIAKRVNQLVDEASDSLTAATEEYDLEVPADAQARVVLASEIDPDAVERAALQAEDEADFLTRIEEILREAHHSATDAPGRAESQAQPETATGADQARRTDTAGTGRGEGGDQALVAEEPEQARVDQIGHVRLAGLDVRLEQRAGSHRRRGWPPLAGHYGYIQNGAEQIGVFVRPGTPTDFDGPVFVADQVRPDGTFDEHKVLIGWTTRLGARFALNDSYPKNHKKAPITQLSMREFKAWLASGDRDKPLSPDLDSTETRRRAVRVSSSAVEEPAGQAQYRVDEPQPVGQQLSLPLAPREDRAGEGPSRTGKLRAARTVSVDSAPDPAGVYATRTALVAERSRRIPVARVQTPQDAARAFSYLGDYAVEHLDALVTDKQGKPLAIVGSFKGAIGQTSVHPGTLISEAFRVNGAAHIWFSHNHPSGKAEFSSADRYLYNELRSRLRGTGIEPMGMFAQTFTRSSGDWVYTDGNDTFNGRASREDGKVSVPIVERIMVQQGRLDSAVSSPAAARAAADDVAIPGHDGPVLLLLDSQNVPVGAYPLKPGEVGKLRDGKRAADLFRALSVPNASGVILVNRKGALTEAEVQNVLSAVIAAEAKPLDVLTPEGERWVSHAESGKQMGNSTFFSRQGKKGSMTVEQVREAAERTRQTWKNAPLVEVLASFDDAPAAAQSAVRKDAKGTPDAFYWNGTVYLVADQLPTDPDVSRAMLHEVVGHLGLRGAFGDALDAQLRLVMVGRRDEVQAKAREYGLDPSKREDLLIAAEEVLAALAEKNPQLNLVQRAIAAIRKWLREHIPMLADMPLSDAELVAQFLEPARRFVQEGRAVPSNAPVRFSLARDDAPIARPKLGRKASDVVQRVKNRASDYRWLGLHMLGRRQIVEIYKDDIPALAKYNELAQRMDADINETAAAADGLARRWAKVKDERALAELMHDATVADFDPDPKVAPRDGSGKERPLLPAERVLRDRFQSLSPEAQAIYREARDTYNKHWNAVRKEIQARIIRSVPDHKRRAQLLARMDADFFGKTPGVYFPLARFGDYLVVVKKDKEAVSVSMAETLNEAEDLRKELGAKFPDHTVSKVLKRAEFTASRDSVGRGFMAKLFEVLDEAGITDDSIIDSLNQLYLESLPDVSWAKHGLHRKGTPGFSQDARRAFAQHQFHGAKYLARLRYSDQLSDALELMQKQVHAHRDDAKYDSIAAQDVVNEMKKRHDVYLNPMSHPLATTLTSVGFVWFLGLSPAAAVVNMSQTPLVAYPLMGAKWGFGKAASALLAASSDTVKGGNDLRGKLKGDEQRAFDEAVRSGVIDVTMAHDLAGIAQGEDAKTHARLRPVMRAAAFLFHHAERFNRQATFLAAYRLARQDPKVLHDQAYEQAVDITYRSHFDYSAGNRPLAMVGNVARVVLLFKSFAQNMVYLLTRQALLAAKGDKEARKAFAGLLLSHAMGAGVLGLPVVGTLLGAASLLGSSDDEPWDAQVALRNLLADALGQKPAEVLARGVSRLTPWDISGRVGLDRLLMPDVREGLEGARLAEAWLASAAGPVAGIGVGALKGLQLIGDGHYHRGIEEMLPLSIRGPVRSVRFAKEGAVDKTGIPIVDETTVFEELGQALGFSPSRVREAFEGKSAIFQADRRLNQRRQALMTAYAQASKAEDQEALEAIRDEIRGFNDKNPARKITQQNLLQSLRMREKRLTEAEQGLYLPKKRRDVQDAGRFAQP